MAHRTITLEAKGVGCPLVRTGDKWTVNDREISCSPDTKICAQAVCSIFPKLESLLKVTPTDMSLPPMQWRCEGLGCQVIFKAEPFRPARPSQSAASAKPAPRTESLTRRMERGAEAAGAKLKESGTFMSRLPSAVAAKLVSLSAKKKYAHGEIILSDGVRGELLYIVGEGKAEVARRSTRDASETVLAVLEAGECFGEMSLLTGEPTSALVRARGEATIYSLTREQVDALLAESPELNRIFSQLLAARLRTVNVTLESELSRGIIGKLSMISMIDLVQTLNASRRSGTLILTGRGQEGHVVFLNGQVSAASWGAQQGEDAFHALVAWPDGDFCFEQEKQEIPEQGRIRKDTMGLLMESLRRIDDAKRQQSS